MNTRRGMGKGTGKIGYYNLAPMDAHIHSLSAKGVKSYPYGKITGKFSILSPTATKDPKYLKELNDMQSYKYVLDIRTGKSYPRVRYGYETGGGYGKYCPDCGVRKGFYHQKNCDVERSPIPSEEGGQLLSSENAGDYSLNAKGNTFRKYNFEKKRWEKFEPEDLNAKGKKDWVDRLYGHKTSKKTKFVTKGVVYTAGALALLGASSKVLSARGKANRPLSMRWTDIRDYVDTHTDSQIINWAKKEKDTLFVEAVVNQAFEKNLRYDVYKKIMSKKR
jgi:hypothetical protein